jgi:hypothetical protein
VVLKLMESLPKPPPEKLGLEFVRFILDESREVFSASPVLTEPPIVLPEESADPEFAFWLLELFIVRPFELLCEKLFE